MQFAKAVIEDLTGIRAIWEEQFTTDSEYLSIMFGEIMPECTSYVCREDSKIISALSLMPMLFTDDSTDIKLHGWYMFGVATLKNHWGKRIAVQVIKYALEQIEKEGYSFVFERPASQSLNEYYRKLGFSKQLEYIPQSFKIAADCGSTGNTPRETTLGIVTENILKEIRESQPKRFEWTKLSTLRSLIKIGELDFHNVTYCETPPEGVFISIKTMNGTLEEIFNKTFFCFPME